MAFYQHQLRAHDEEAVPVTLPKLAWLDKAPLHDDARAETRAIKAGADAWRLIGRVGSFQNWMVIGRALARIFLEKFRRQLTRRKAIL
jgi:hypothetical protein